jgi:general L-amino acid transport system permease protein
VAVVWFLGSEAAGNLARRHATFGFGFLADNTNFDIPFRLIPWAVGDTYARALLVCVLNTLLVSAMSIVAATLLGLMVGIMRLSANWLVRNIALGFIELVRNTPQLVQIIFWYVAVLQTLPGPRQSIPLPAGSLLNVRGLYLPSLEPGAAAAMLWPIAAVALIATPFVWRTKWRGLPLGTRSLLLPLLAIGLYATGIDHIDYPQLRGFNIAGGIQVIPELIALWAGLTIYASAFIAEIVRAAILSVHKGQREAALSLGLRPRQVLSKVVLPQALRVMIPPLTSQYLNIIKSSSLGAAVAYPELFQIFAGTVLQQTAREIETMFLLMAIFLSINLSVSALMNWYNHRVALVSR